MNKKSINSLLKLNIYDFIDMWGVLSIKGVFDNFQLLQKEV